MSDDKFDLHPQFENHFCHFKPWAEHFKEAPGTTGVLARMLGYAWAEVEHLREIGVLEHKAVSAFQHAYVFGGTVEEALKNEPCSPAQAMKEMGVYMERRSKGLFVWPS